MDNFEPTNIDELDEVLAHFNSFHDDYVAGIEIKFENYKALDDDGESTGIGSADKTIILTVNTYPYGKDHNQLVQVEFQDVKSFEIKSPQEDPVPAWGNPGPTWGTLDTYTSLGPGESGIRWEFMFICGDTEFIVVCDKIVFRKQNQNS